MSNLASENKEGKKKTILIISIIVGIVLISNGLVIYMEPRQSNESYLVASSSLSSNESIHVQLKNNLLYGNNTTLTNPKQVFLNITKGIFVSYSIYYDSTSIRSTNASLSYTVFLNSSNPSWSRITYSYAGVFNIQSGKPLNMYFNIDPAQNFTLGKEINAQLDVKGNIFYSIWLKFSSYVNDMNSVSGVLIRNSSDNQYLITLQNDSKSDFINIIGNKLVGKPPIIPLNDNFSYVFIFAGLFAISFPFVTFKKNSNDVKKFKNTYKDILVEVNTGPTNTAKYVTKPEDIIKIANIAESPIFINGNKIFIDLNGMEYYSEIRE